MEEKGKEQSTSPQAKSFQIHKEVKGREKGTF